MGNGLNLGYPYRCKMDRIFSLLTNQKFLQAVYERNIAEFAKYNVTWVNSSAVCIDDKYYVITVQPKNKSYILSDIKEIEKPAGSTQSVLEFALLSNNPELIEFLQDCEYTLGSIVFQGIELKCVEFTDGYDNGAQSLSFVLTDGKDFFRIDGYDDSYNGDSDWSEKVELVKPVKKEITVYESI